jgi:hypothetical protein
MFSYNSVLDTFIKPKKTQFFFLLAVLLYILQQNYTHI